MSLCGCYPGCTCTLNVAPPELLMLSGNGDPASGGWLLTALETIFSAVNNDGGISIIPGGSYGHNPSLDLIVTDTDSVDLNVNIGNGLTADVRIDPASPVAIDITPDGLSISSVPAAAGGMFPGVVLDYYGAAAPAGWLLCYGQLEDIIDYPALFAAIGHAGSAGIDPGGAQFTIPDLRGRVTVGLDNMGGVDAGRLTAANTLGGVGGSEDAQLAVLNLPAHTHTGTDSGHTHAGTTDAAGAHDHTPATGGRSFVTVSGTPTQVNVNATSPNDVTRWVAGSSGGATVQQLDLGINHQMVVSGPGPDFDTSGAQLNNATTSTAAAHTHTFTTASGSANISVTGGGNGAATGNAFLILQPYQLVNKIIKT